MSEPEPRRSVRATKGQHTKSFDEVEPTPPPAKRRQTKKSKKAQEQDTEDDDQEEIIRCICGATEQDEDSGEAWISCESCNAWQHNVCVGVSSYEDEIPDNYWCEQCRPENHTELLEGMARGEKPWEDRRKAFEERKKRRGGRRPKGGRKSDSKEDTDKDREARSKMKASPTPDSVRDKKEESGRGKRKSREDSHDTDTKASKSRRVSSSPAPSKPKYTPPKDLEPAIKELPPTRNGPAKALKKSLVHVMTNMAKDGEIEVPEGSSVDAMAELSAIQVERAVFDTHPMSKGQKEYSQQIKSLTFNLKNNPELVHGLMEGMHTPTTLAVMTSDQLASAEMQRQTAEMRAKAEKASILYKQDSGPRVRRTHKGEEVVEDETLVNENDENPSLAAGRAASSRRSVSSAAPTREQGIKDESGGVDMVELPARSPSQEEATGSPSQANFDINKVFSSVRSPSTSQPPRRPSALATPAVGPGEDADVDRMLQDDNDSPPYSPTEEAQDPDVIWRGSLAMSSIADFTACAKHVGGANFASMGPWSKLIPQRLAVAGRIPQQSAIEYLCGLRYSSLTDVIVVSLEPASEEKRPEFLAVIDYFISKKRYGVVGDKVAGNVRDTYLVPVPPGEDNHPEFMLNLMDNHIPKSRTEPMLLAVFVYRNDPSRAKTGTPPTPSSATPTTPGPAAASGFAQKRNSTSGPAFSPATPQGTTSNGALHSTTPVPIPRPPQVSQAPQAAPPPAQQSATPQPGSAEDAQRQQAMQRGQAIAREVLGPELMSSPTAQFLLTQAWRMSRLEWEVIKNIYEREPKSRTDLPFLGGLMEKEAKS